ncbi:adenylyltransferase/cytidyltransferase family protein [thiotrophic endosymbiont of Bathymodiolus puteoserpentis (Logatchev)]|jgi:glycerol-3-phosphate cytidylyltransferase|uniref:adenylyltransferase/cytidyltransferase family protein n=1 Tax=thiotrophic endosymbiont of Bathymodiolus puteoserpentis (Logatchev) TaxID=343240 RepID=UPI0010B31708|nr:adenylyltransferase/cytidyltransferase family protein [thiotrophic endosymbiont of Bathymodiolus puteoserpentis (Logatchev)]CAC9489499.1 Glycerol-3-phosphate cytidylyltransferase (EC 2.7.7.39) [uncultured Gammaproteobacteria bacterium]CAC9977934.1 Glycerol-3-phosphate cytidylyltransferase (EC 2.7.7.39) [uncultured Gammaproteobacteria bacterium]SSC11210.1 Glycerol-3-phosphate cytidylyltransferase [thiotrophic endosymbiont of Bathymodiolus puteoserpentis (Logatchev)]
MIKVITYGTFDLFHIGHWNLLNRAKNEGNYLIVAISSDEFNLRKGKKSQMEFQERCKVVKSLSFVDKVIVENSWKQKESDIKKYGVNVFVMGDDWQGRFDDLKKYCQVKYLPRTSNISSSILKKLFNHEK